MPRFIIMEENPLIAEDLAEALRAGVADCVIAIATTLEEAEAMLIRQSHLTAAFLRAPVDRLRESGVADRVTALGARLVVLADPDVEQTEAGWIMVPSPFTSEMIADALSHIDTGAESGGSARQDRPGQ